MKSVGLLVIATNKYNQFVTQFIKSVNKFAPIFNTIFLFTDQPRKDLNVINIKIEHKPWPAMTLTRYHLFNNNRQILLDNTDYLVYNDIDMRYMSNVSNEILPTGEQKYIATLHPGFWKGGGSWEERPTCISAYVPTQLRRTYFAGGMQGGRTEDYLNVSANLITLLDYDLSMGITPVWNDESCWNMHLSCCNPNEILELSPDYCYPEPCNEHSWFNWHGSAKILALNKNHNELRS